MPKVDLGALHASQRSVIIDFAREPRPFSGRGIVTTVYDREFASAWVLLSELARLGVALPIEAFHRPGELSERNAALIASFGPQVSLRRLNDRAERFAIKPWAIWRSSFREVLWIDTDNFPLRDPGFLFDDPEFLQKGSLFWRDVTGADRSGMWHPQSDVWKVFNIPANDSEEFEAGQLLVDKEKRWAELGLVLSFVQNSIYQSLVHGDKDLFRLAWQYVASARKKAPPPVDYLRDPGLVPYGFMPFGPFHMGRPNDVHKWGGGTVMVQRDRTGQALFNHRNVDKFSTGQNIFNADIQNEAIYHAHIERLRNLPSKR
ncbi:hypothetical protein BH10PSE9_BH10PSE9_18730 [soil metagenome]